MGVSPKRYIAPTPQNNTGISDIEATLGPGRYGSLGLQSPTATQGPRNIRTNGTVPVPPYGVPLDNRLTHQVGTLGINGPAFSSKWGELKPFLRTTPNRPARMTDGRANVSTYMGEIPFRQNFNATHPQFVITSPGKANVNRPQLTAQDVLVLQAIRKRVQGS